MSTPAQDRRYLHHVSHITRYLSFHAQYPWPSSVCDLESLRHLRQQPQILTQAKLKALKTHRHPWAKAMVAATYASHFDIALPKTFEASFSNAFEEITTELNRPIRSSVPRLRQKAHWVELEHALKAIYGHTRQGREKPSKELCHQILWKYPGAIPASWAIASLIPSPALPPFSPYMEPEESLEDVQAWTHHQRLDFLQALQAALMDPLLLKHLHHQDLRMRQHYTKIDHATRRLYQIPPTPKPLKIL